MSKELKGANGKLVGIIKYFEENNTGCSVGKLLRDYNFNFYDTLKNISNNISKIFDEVYEDLKINEKYLSYIYDSDRKQTVEIIKGMADFCKITSISTSGADKCINIISKNTKSRSGVSDSYITSSAKYVLSNWYFNKKDSINLLENCIKNGVSKTINGNSNIEKFIKEVQKSSNSYYLEDVILKVNYLDAGKKLTGKCGKELCSKSYNGYISNVITGTTSVSGSHEYGKIARDGLKILANKVKNDLERGINDNDYVKSENVENLIKFHKDIENCGERSYNITEKANRLNWFVGGDEEKILKVQKKINSANIGIKIKEDGVYGKETEKAWVDYIDKCKQLYKRGETEVKGIFDKNWVLGVGKSFSATAFVSISAGVMIYLDDDLNMAIMLNNSVGVESTIGVSAGRIGELSTTANSVSDMAGNSISFGGGIKQFGYTHSGSFATESAMPNAVTSNAIAISKGVSFKIPSVNVYKSTNISVKEFNLKRYLNIK